MKVWSRKSTWICSENHVAGIWGGAGRGAWLISGDSFECHAEGFKFKSIRKRKQGRVFFFFFKIN